MSAGFLIIEDEPSVARSLSRYFRKHRPVTLASSLGEARNALSDGRVWSGIVLDLVLPDGSGIELLEELRNKHVGTPVLVITGEFNRDIVNKAQSLRAEYVCKPASAENLAPFIQTALARERVGDETIGTRIDGLTKQLGLTKRESELLSLACDGLSRRDLADKLGVAENTVKAQIRSLLKKSGARSLATLAQQVLRGQE